MKYYFTQGERKEKQGGGENASRYNGKKAKDVSITKPKCLGVRSNAEKDLKHLLDQFQDTPEISHLISKLLSQSFRKIVPLLSNQKLDIKKTND